MEMRKKICEIEGASESWACLKGGKGNLKNL